MYLKGEKVGGLPIARILPMKGDAAPAAFLVEHVAFSGEETRAWVVADGEASVEAGLRGFRRFVEGGSEQHVDVIAAGPGMPEEMLSVAAELEKIHASSETGMDAAVSIAEAVFGESVIAQGRLTDNEIWLGRYGNPADSIDAAIALASEVGIDPKRLLIEATGHDEVRHVSRHIARRFTVSLLRGLAAGRA